MTDQTGAEGPTQEAPSGEAKMPGEGLADQARGKMQDGFSQARETVSGVVADLSGQARSAAAGMQERVGTLGEALEASVHERPLLALAAVGALGYLLAVLVHRR